MTSDSFQKQPGGGPASDRLSIDKLRLKTLLGRGGFAAVWLAEYGGQQVAVKVNLPAGASGTMVVVPQEVTQMFMREAEVTAGLAHRHIIRCLGTLQLPADFPLPGLEKEGLATRRPEPSEAMVLELCEPTSAKHLIIRAITTGRARAYTTAQALRWCEQVAGALAYLHRQKPCIIHRDVKQENILFRKGEGGTLEAKLADLGLHVAIEMDRKVMLRRRSVTAGSSLSGAVTAAAAGNGNGLSSAVISAGSGAVPSRGPSANGGGGGVNGPSTPASNAAGGVRGGSSASQLLPSAAGASAATAAGGRLSSVTAAVSGVTSSPFLTISPGATPAHSRTPSASTLGPRPGSSSAALHAQAPSGGVSGMLLAKEEEQAKVEAAALPVSPWALGMGLPQEALAGVAELDAAESGAGSAAQPAHSGPTDPAQVRSCVAGAAAVSGGRGSGAGGGGVASASAAAASEGDAGMTTFTSCTPATSVGVEDVELLAATAEARRPGSAAAAPSGAGGNSPGGGCGSGGGAASRPASGKQVPLDQVALPGGASLLPAGGAQPADTVSGDELDRADSSRGSQGPRSGSPSPLRSPLLSPAGPTALIITEEEDAAGQDGACAASAFASQAAVAVAAAAVGAEGGGTCASGNAPGHSSERAAAAVTTAGAATAAATSAGAVDGQSSPAAAATSAASATLAAGAAPVISKVRSGSLQQPMAAALLKSRSLKQRASGGVGAGGEAAAVALVTPFASAVPVVTPPGSGGGATATPNTSAGGDAGTGEQRPLPLHTSESLGTMLARQPSLVTPVDSGTARSGLRAVRSLLQQLGKRELRPLRKGDLEWVYGLTGRAGSYMYMAPEVWSRVPYNEKVDVFSFGVVMYELLSRDLLLLSHFNTSRAAQLGIRSPADYVSLVSKGYRPPRPMRLINDAAWDLITACWHDDPVQRPDMDTVLVRLQELIRHELDGGAGGRSWRRTAVKRIEEEAGEAAGSPAGAAGGPKPPGGCSCAIS